MKTAKELYQISVRNEEAAAEKNEKVAISVMDIIEAKLVEVASDGEYSVRLVSSELSNAVKYEGNFNEVLKYVISNLRDLGYFARPIKDTANNVAITEVEVGWFDPKEPVESF